MFYPVLYPALQAQVKDPIVFVQVAAAAQLLLPPVAHSLTSEHVIPSPEYPALQVQVYDPTVFKQVAVAAHEFDPPAAHSSISEHVIPLPE